MEKEAYYKSGILSWVFIPTYIIMTLIQYGLFCLYNGSFHPMYCVLAETTKIDNIEEENIAKTDRTQMREQITEVREKCMAQNQRIEELQTMMNRVLSKLTELDVDFHQQQTGAAVANTIISVAEIQEKLEVLPQIKI